jgi:hypothetical protein
MKMELIKYRDAGMQTYTYFWKNEKNQMVSPFFDSEAEAMTWTKETINRKLLEDAQAEDEAFEMITRKQS